MNQKTNAEEIGLTTYHNPGSSSNQFRTVSRSFVIWGVVALRYLGRFNVSNRTCFAGNATLSSEEWCGGWRGIAHWHGRARPSDRCWICRCRLSGTRSWPVVASIVGRSLSALFYLKGRHGRWRWPRCGRPAKSESRNPSYGQEIRSRLNQRHKRVMHMERRIILWEIYTDSIH